MKNKRLRNRVRSKASSHPPFTPNFNYSKLLEILKIVMQGVENILRYTIHPPETANSIIIPCEKQQDPSRDTQY